MMMDDSYGEDDVEETYIDPNDLIIISKQQENIWEPTDDQIRAYAFKLGMNPDTDPKEVLDIASKYLTERLPADWERAFIKNTLEVLYINLQTNEIQLETDLESFAKKEYNDFMEMEREKNEHANKKVTVVPRKKIAPIGSKQRQENKIEQREKEIVEKLKKAKKDEYEDEETKQLKNKFNKANERAAFSSKVNDDIEEQHIKSNNNQQGNNHFKQNPTYNNEIFHPPNYKEQDFLYIHNHNSNNIQDNSEQNDNEDDDDDEDNKIYQIDNLTSNEDDIKPKIKHVDNNNNSNDINEIPPKYARKDRRRQKQVYSSNEEVREKMKEIEKEDEDADYNDNDNSNNNSNKHYKNKYSNLNNSNNDSENIGGYVNIEVPQSKKKRSKERERNKQSSQDDNNTNTNKSNNSLGRNTSDNKKSINKFYSNDSNSENISNKKDEPRLNLNEKNNNTYNLNSNDDEEFGIEIDNDDDNDNENENEEHSLINEEENEDEDEEEQQHSHVNIHSKHVRSTDLAFDINTNHKGDYLTPLQHKPNDNISDSEDNNNNNNYDYLQQQKAEIEQQAEDELTKFKQDLLNRIKERKQQLITAHNKKLQSEIDSLHKQYQTKTQTAISNIKSQYKSKLKSEKDKILSAEKDSYNNASLLNTSEIESLISQKEKLLLQISNQKQQNEIKTRMKAQENQNNLNKSKYTINESFKLKKENIKTKHNAALSKLQTQHKTKLQQLLQTQIEHKPQRSNTVNTALLESSANEILKEYQRHLDEMFENKKQKIEKECKQNMHNELESFRLASMTETSNKKNYFNNENVNLEKKFQNDISDIRCKNSETFTLNDKHINDELNQLNNIFDKIKKDTETALSNEIKKIIIDIQHYIRTENGNNNDNDIKNLEDKIEEYVVNAHNQVKINLKKYKSLYDIKEKEYKYLELQLQYFVDLLLIIKNNLLETPFSDDNEDDDDDDNGVDNESKRDMNVTYNRNKIKAEQMVKRLFKLGKDKQNEYRIKFQHCKTIPFFPFMELSLQEKNFYPQESEINNTIMMLNKNNNNNMNDLTTYNNELNQQQYEYEYDNTSPMKSSSQQNIYFNQSVRTNNQQQQPDHEYNNTYTGNNQFINNNNNNRSQRPFSASPLPHNYSTRQLSRADNNNNTFYNYEQQQQQPFDSPHNHSLYRTNIYERTNPRNISNQQQLISDDTLHSASSPQMQLLSTTMKLPPEIANELPKDDFILYSSIIDFISSERLNLDKELYNITRQRQLSNTLSEINENGDMLNYSHAFNEEKIKTIYLEKAYKNKSDTFELIKSYINEAFLFITDNPTRKDVFTSKFKLITKHIDDYYKTFGNGFAVEQQQQQKLTVDRSPLMSIEFQSGRRNNNNNMEQQQMPIQQQYHTNYKVDNLRNTFTNFYMMYEPNKLAKSFHSNYAHGFFNSKKNNDDVNYKVMSNMNYHSYLQNNYTLGKGYW